MQIKKSAMIVAVIGLLIGGYSAMQLPKDKAADYSWVETVTGEVKVTAGAEDPDFHVKVDNPVLIRTVEMFQMVQDSNDKTKVDYVWDSKHLSDIEMEQDFFDKLALWDDVDKSFYDGKVFKNPKFPTEPKSQVFVGKAEIGEDGMKLSDKLVEKFSMEQYVYFKNPTKIMDLLLDTEEVNDYDMILVGNSMYATDARDADDYDAKIGDLRVTFKTVDKSEIEGKTFTAAGRIENGEIGGKNSALANIYDSEKNVDEIRSEFKSGKIGMHKFGVGFGVLMLVIAVFMTVRSGKKEE